MSGKKPLKDQKNLRDRDNDRMLIHFPRKGSHDKVMFFFRSKEEQARQPQPPQPRPQLPRGEEGPPSFGI